jgi:hypothetical protein
MLIAGILTAILFIISLIAMIEFPDAFKALAFGMLGAALAFLLLRTIYNFRKTFRVKAKNKATHK